MTISIQTQKRKFGREWLGNKDQKARQGQFRFSFLLSFSPSMQFHSCDTDKFCISETAGVLQWRAGPSKDYSYTKHRVKLNPLYSLSHVWTKKKKKRAAEKYQEVALQLRWLNCGAVVKVKEVLKCRRRPFSTQLINTLQPCLILSAVVVSFEFCSADRAQQKKKEKKKVILVHRDTNNQSGHKILSLQRLELKPWGL